MGEQRFNNVFKAQDFLTFRFTILSVLKYWLTVLRLMHWFWASHLYSRQQQGDWVGIGGLILFFEENNCILEDCPPLTCRLPTSHCLELCHTFILVWKGTENKLYSFFFFYLYSRCGQRSVELAKLQYNVTQE